MDPQQISTPQLQPHDGGIGTGNGMMNGGGIDGNGGHIGGINGVLYVKVMTDEQLEILRTQIAVYATICEQLVEMHKAITAQQDLAGFSLSCFYDYIYLYLLHLLNWSLFFNLISLTNSGFLTFIFFMGFNFIGF